MFNSTNLRYAVFMLTIIFSAGCVWAAENERGAGSGLTMEFVRIPAGSFNMGSPSTEEDRNDNEGPVHEVQITKPFYMGKYEVTQAQWETVMGTTVAQQRKKSIFPLRLKGEGSRHPIYYITWEEAVEFCKKLGEDFRLPTEAEWEYACRAGSQTRFFYGDDPNYTQLDQYAWYYDNSDNQTHPVGQKKPNPWGLYDMYGNVSEWCSDQYLVLGGYNVTKDIDQKKLAYRYFGHVYRNGNWYWKPDKCRSASRIGIKGIGSDLNGFRVVYAGDTNNNEEVLEITLPKGTATEQEPKSKIPSNDWLIITGVVRDEKNLPIDDVEMNVWPNSGWFVRVYAKGQFEAYNMPPNKKSEEYHMLARHIERNLAAVIDFDEDVNMLEVKLEHGAILTGKVVDSNGVAIEGARVGTSLQGSDWRAFILPLDMKSDAEGKFTFRALPLGHKYIFYASFLHYKPNKIEFDSSDVRDNLIDLGSVVLARGKYSVSGIVVDVNDKPVANAEIFCTGKGQVGAGAVTDEEGRFKLDGIFKGQVRITAGFRRGRSGSWDSWRSIEAEAGAANVKIVLNNSGYAPPKGRTCFLGQTEVWLEGKLVPISKVAALQFINCTDGLNKIEQVQEHTGTFTCYDILLESGNCITVAENHYFMTDSGRWLSLHNLKTGMKLKTSKGSIGILNVTKRPMPYIGKVYNIKVKGSDRYMVGKDGVVVRDY